MVWGRAGRHAGPGRMGLSSGSSAGSGSQPQHPHEAFSTPRRLFGQFGQASGELQRSN